MRAVDVEVPVQIVFHGQVTSGAEQYAREKIGALHHYVREPVMFERIRLTQLPDPAVERPSVAEATLDVAGHQVRAQVAAPTMREAIDRLHDRLRNRLERVNPHWEARRGGAPLPADQGVVPWRHGSEPTHRPAFYPRPVAERQVVRHKTYALSHEGVDDAILEMESLDYDFHLFTDGATGEERVVSRVTPDTYRLASVYGIPDAHVASEHDVVGDPQPAPRSTVREARNRLDLEDLPFLFFTNPVSGHGALLYRRYDGHYGLVTARAT